MRMTEATFEAAIAEKLDYEELYGEAVAENDDTGEEEAQTASATVTRIRTYSDAGMLTMNRGLVVRLDDGTEFQVTIVQSDRGR